MSGFLTHSSIISQLLKNVLFLSVLKTAIIADDSLNVKARLTLKMAEGMCRQLKEFQNTTVLQPPLVTTPNRSMLSAAGEAQWKLCDATGCQPFKFYFYGPVGRDKYPEEEGDEDDIISYPSEDRNGIADKAYLWPVSTFFYKIAKNFTKDEKATIEEAIYELKRSTCLTYFDVDRITTPPNDYVYYVKINRGTCRSHLGRTGGMQEIYLTSSCMIQVGTIVHETMHALGMAHEHTRSDRDQFVTVYENRIQPNHLKSFKILPNFLNLDKYDYESVMHYSKYAYGIKDTDVTIDPKDEFAFIGQRDKLSRLDATKINILYSYCA